MSYDSCLRIERVANGYSVTLRDPAIIAKNQKRDSSKGPYAPYQDPERTYIFKTCAELTAFITKNIDKALPAQSASDSFESAFDKAAAAATKE